MARTGRLLTAVRSQGAGAFVADTAPILYYVEGTVPRLAHACQELFEAVERGLLDCILSSITVAELLIVPFRGPPETVVALDAFIRQPRVSVLPADESIARAGARLLAGRVVTRLPDAFIVATALELGLPLVTGDRRLARAAVVPTFVVADFARGA